MSAGDESRIYSRTAWSVSPTLILESQEVFTLSLAVPLLEEVAAGCMALILPFLLRIESAWRTCMQSIRAYK